MALEFNNISFRYGNTAVLSAVNLIAKSGEITCLLGSSGGGKSTLLKLAMGIEKIQQGQLLLNDTLLADKDYHPAPEQRPIGMMFQHNALFPHMTVLDNIRFGLNHLTRNEQKKLAQQWLDNVGLNGFEKRYPHTLSGGQQQRIALARALAPQPQILLMDEPYGSIDSSLRRQLREAARQTLKQNNTATILVTHDPSEAMEMADHIAILENGHIVQTGTPQELYEQPCSAAVASFFGEPQLINAKIFDDGFKTEYGFIHCPQAILNSLSSDQPYTLLIRPNGLIISSCQNELNSPKEDQLSVVDSRYVDGKWLFYLLPENSRTHLIPLRVEHHINNTNLDIDIKIGSKVKLSANSTGFFIYSDKTITY